MNITGLLFDGWQDPLRTLIVGFLTYILIMFLRLSEKRSLAKMNAFDLVITVAHGSMLATVLLNRGVNLPEGGRGHPYSALNRFAPERTG